MDRQSIHPTESQIEEYLSDNSRVALGPESKYEEVHAASKYVEAHISECTQCRKKVLEAESRRLNILSPGQATAPHKECPSREALQEYAAGLATAETATKIIHHAAHCDFCGPLLKTYIQDLSDELSPEAQEFIDRLPDAEPQWPPPTFWARFKRIFQRGGIVWPKLAFGGVALATMAAFVPPIITTVQIRNAEKLVQAAFVENPKTDQRYVWAPHTFDSKLGGNEAAGGGDAFHDIQHLAYQQRYSSDRHWLRINGRFALLTKDPQAVDFLQKAYDKGMKDPGTEIDLAAAYFLRDTSNPAVQTAAGTHNVEATVQLLHKVLKEENLTPDQREAALFNLAVAYEAMIRWDLAISTWEQYLALDSGGPWREEADRHLAADRARARSPAPSGYKSPAYFKDHSSDPETENRIEDYQDVALRIWVLNLVGSDAAESQQAVRLLADVLEEQHGDPWMKDFLNRRSPGDMRGIEALSAAITSNRRGLPTDAIQHAGAAEKIFEQTANVPGVLRARFEQVYANQRLMEAKACANAAERLAFSLRDTHYRWLRVQTALTESVCLNRDHKSDAADQKLRTGRDEAIRFGFHILLLRAFSLDAGNRVSRHCDGTWQTATAGLEIYWQGPRLPMRLYELYSPIKQCLESEKLWYAAEALQRKLIAILETDVDPEDRNLTLISTARRGLKPILIAMNEPASEQSSEPSHLDPVISTYQLPTTLEIAELQLDNDTQSALATVEEAAPLVEKTHDEVIRLRFYRIKGGALLKLRRLPEAEAAYTDGLDITEKAFGLLPDQEERLSWMNETSEIYRGMVGVMLEQGRNEQALQLWEWYLSRSWDSEGDHKSLAGGISWSEINNQARLTDLSSTGTRLVYAVIQGRIYLWAIVNGRLFMPPPQEIASERLRQQISDFANEIADENSNILTLEEDSQRLFSLLLDPVAMDLPEAGTVAVELDPAMVGLVLEALKSPKGWYVGQKYSVAYSPGLIEERKLRPLAHHVRGREWLLNALTVSDKDMHLSGIEVVNAYNFNRAQFPELLGSAELFFFLGHGEPGGLRMPNSPLLQPEDFPPQSLQRLQLVGLFGCSTGTVRKGLPDTSNLVHQLLSGGVPAIIASRWDVSRSSTTELMTSFYAHFQSGDSPADAMLAARREVFREHTHPYYWAAFTLTGRAG